MIAAPQGAHHPFTQLYRGLTVLYCARLDTGRTTTPGGFNMIRRHVANFLLASSLGLGLPAANEALAQPMPGGMGDGGHPMMRLRGLDLTEAQRDQVFKIFHEQAPAVHEQMK